MEDFLPQQQAVMAFLFVCFVFNDYFYTLSSDAKKLDFKENDKYHIGILVVGLQFCEQLT